MSFFALLLVLLFILCFYFFVCFLFSFHFRWAGVTVCVCRVIMASKSERKCIYTKFIVAANEQINPTKVINLCRIIIFIFIASIINPFTLYHTFLFFSPSASTTDCLKPSMFLFFAHKFWFKSLKLWGKENNVYITNHKEAGRGLREQKEAKPNPTTPLHESIIRKWIRSG